MRLIFDTNIWISFAISTELEWLDNIIRNQDNEILYSDRLYYEFLNVSKREKLKKYLSERKLELIQNFFETIGEKIEITSTLTICRDPKDNYLLELAKDGKANYLITGDQDLLILGEINTCKILSLRGFKEIKL